MEQPIMGSTMQDLRNQQNMGQVKYSAGQSLQYEQGHNAAHQMHQAQHLPYKDCNVPNYPQFNQAPSKRAVQEAVDIEELAKEINNNMHDDMIDTFASVSESNDSAVSTHSPKFAIVEAVPTLLREPLLVLIAYIVLSQPGVHSFFAKYISQINPDDSGRVAFSGVLIYGVLLAALYAVLRHFLL